MWGICSDFESFQDGLFQAVVHYKADVTNNKAILLLPIKGYTPDIGKIKELPTPPKYPYHEHVFPRNHPNITGTVETIGWHYKENGYFYKIKVDGKVRSFRYFEKDLLPHIPG